MDNLRVHIEIEGEKVRATNLDTGATTSGNYRAKEAPDGHLVLVCSVVWETEVSERRTAFQVVEGRNDS